MKKNIFIFVGVITILGVIAFVAFKSLNSNIETAQKDPRFEQLPPIISKVKGLEVVNARIINPGVSEASVLIDVKNNSPKAIIAVTVESGDKKDSAGTTISGFGEDPPAIIAKPFQIFTINLSMSKIIRGLPVRVNAVTYSDNSEDGEIGAVDRIRKFREKAKENKKEGIRE